MRKALILVLALLVGCGGDDPVEPESDPEPVDLSGAWVGTYTSTLDPGVIFSANLTVSQTQESLSGGLVTDAPRSADMTGVLLEGGVASMHFEFTDDCGGEADIAADVVDPARLEGSYSATDCTGTYSGEMAFNKQ